MRKRYFVYATRSTSFDIEIEFMLVYFFNPSQDLLVKLLKQLFLRIGYEIYTKYISGLRFEVKVMVCARYALLFFVLA